MLQAAAATLVARHDARRPGLVCEQAECFLRDLIGSRGGETDNTLRCTSSMPAGGRGAERTDERTTRARARTQRRGMGRGMGPVYSCRKVQSVSRGTFYMRVSPHSHTLRLSLDLERPRLHAKVHTRHRSCGCGVRAARACAGHMLSPSTKLPYHVPRPSCERYTTEVRTVCFLPAPYDPREPCAKAH